MVSIIKLYCPHCGVEGQLVMPDSDALIVGPCPKCSQLVVIFAGKALALNTDFMRHASQEEAYKHIQDVLSAFVRERVDHLFSIVSSSAATIEREKERNAAPLRSTTSAISGLEIRAFLEEELPLLDDPLYFRSIFGNHG